MTAAPAAVTMYTTTWCGYCVRLKKLMQREGIEYAEVNIEQDAAAADLVNPDFAAWARAFNAEGHVIREEADIAPVLDAALAPRRIPAVVHVHASARQVTAWRRV